MALLRKVSYTRNSDITEGVSQLVFCAMAGVHVQPP